MLTSALFCLALNVFHEARGEPVHGQYAVAYVTMNRANWNKNNVCEEVFKPYQFSWTRSFNIPPKSKEWDNSVHVAKAVLKSKPHHSNVGKANYYHHYKIRPKWSKHFKLVKIRGQHVFYEGKYGN